MGPVGAHGERMAGLFLLGVVLFNPPVLGLFGVPALIFGIPAMYLFIFAAWGLVIGLSAWSALRDLDEVPVEEELLDLPPDLMVPLPPTVAARMLDARSRAAPPDGDAAPLTHRPSRGAARPPDGAP